MVRSSEMNGSSTGLMSGAVHIIRTYCPKPRDGAPHLLIDSARVHNFHVTIRGASGRGVIRAHWAERAMRELIMNVPAGVEALCPRSVLSCVPSRFAPLGRQQRPDLAQLGGHVIGVGEQARQRHA